MGPEEWFAPNHPRLLGNDDFDRLTILVRGEICADPEIALDGVPSTTLDGGSMEDHVYDAVDGTLESIPIKRRKDDKLVADAVRRAVRAAVDQQWGKKPIVKVLVCLV